jgi:hypothetical protein
VRVFTDYDNPTRTRAEEGQAECSGKADRSGKGGFGVSPDCDSTQHAHAQKKAKRSCEAERSGVGSFEGLL